MEAIGIIRRIDNLGRIVLPKEIRKNLRIKNGECLEVFLEGENIVLKKQNFFHNYSESLDSLLSIVSKITQSEVLLTDTDQVLYAVGCETSNFDVEQISEDLYHTIMKGQRVFRDSCEIFDGQKNNCLIQPLIISGDIIGSIIFTKKDPFLEKDIVGMNIIHKFLVNYLEI